MAKQEEAKQKPTETARQLPEISTEEREKLARILPEIRQDVEDFKKNMDLFKREHPDLWEKQKNKEQTKAVFHVMDRLLDYLGAGNANLKEAQILQAIDEYNIHAHTINSIYSQVNRDAQEKHDKTISSAIAGELPFDEKQFSEAEKKELKEFAKGVWDELFPKSNVDKFLLWATGRKNNEKIDDYEKLLVAPANGIESAVAGLISLFNPFTYKDLASSIGTMTGMSYNEWCAAVKSLKFAGEQMSTATKVAPIISFLFSIAFLFGGSAKLLSSLSKLKSGSKVKSMITATLATRTMVYQGAKVGKLLPAGTMRWG